MRLLHTALVTGSNRGLDITSTRALHDASLHRHRWPQAGSHNLASLRNTALSVATRVKNIRSEVAGCADTLGVSGLEHSNMLAKQLEYMSLADSAGMVMDARVPVVLTSRADSRQARLASCSIALVLAQQNCVALP